MMFRVRVLNIYDEVLEAPMSFSGSLTVELPRLSNSRKTYALSPSDISFAPGYSPTTGILTIVPGDSMVLNVIYNFEDDSSRVLTDVFTKHADPVCGSRKIADRETFLVRTSVQVYSLVDPVSATALASVCWVDAYIPPGACPPIVGPEGGC